MFFNRKTNFNEPKNPTLSNDDNIGGIENKEKQQLALLSQDVERAIPIDKMPVESAPIPIVMKRLVDEINIIQLQYFYHQFIVMNPNTANGIIDIALHLQPAGIQKDNLAIVGNSKFLVFPPFHFNELYLVFRSFASLVPVYNAICLCYYLPDGNYINPGYFSFP